MKNNVIDIIQRFQTRHALEEERELNETTRDMEFPTPHLERIVRTVRGLPATAKVPMARTEPAAFLITHPILAMLGLSLIAAIGFGCFLVLSIR